MIPPIAITLLLLVGGSIIPGVVALALIVLVVASRAQVVERNVAGSHATVRGTLLWLKAAALLTVYVAVVVLLWNARDDEWHETTQGSTALWALGGLSVFLVREILRLGDASERYWRGGEEERAVGELLDTLRTEGFVVSHNLPIERGGNLDHLVVTPHRRIFAIETKSGRSNASARAQAVSNAVWAKAKFRQGFVTAILCVGTDPPTSPIKNGHVWVLARDHLIPFLRDPPR